MYRRDDGQYADITTDRLVVGEETGMTATGWYMRFGRCWLQ